MRRFIVLPVLLAVALALVATGLADPGDKGKGKKQGKNRFTFTMTNTDRRCDGTEPWATLQEKRTFVIHDNGNGSFRVRRVDRGTFTTVAGKSPGDCPANKSKHGHLVRAGVKGKFGGYLEGTISGVTFNPKATCTGTDCGFTDVFLNTVFGAGAADKFTCFMNSADCKFNYNYTAPNRSANRPRLLFRHWQDRGKGAGTMLNEVFHGDIANS